MRHIEAFDVDDVHIYFIKDTEIPEIEEPEDKMVLYIGSLDSGIVIYGAEMHNITIQDLRRKDERAKAEGEDLNQGSSS